MKFGNLRIKEIINVFKYVPDKMRFSSKNKNSHIIGIQISGNALHTFSDKQLLFKESCVYFLNQAEDYSVTVNEAGTAFSVHFTAYEPICTESFCKQTQNPEKIIQTLERLEREYFKGNELSLFELVYRVCSQINSVYEQGIYLKDRRISGAERYMREHFREKSCLADSAEAANLSERRFNDLFKECFDETPNSYLLNLKISYAKNLMKNEFISISRVAEMCGFCDICHFSRCFKKRVGITPSEYRRSVLRSK